MLSNKEKPVFHLLLIFLILFCGITAFLWIRQGETSKELLANYAKMVDYFEGMQSVEGWPWWTPHFNGGHSMADSLGTIITYILMFFGSIFGGVIAKPAMIVGPKLIGSAMMFLSGAAMFFFMRRLNPDPWCALASSIFYVICPQLTLRLAYSEHLVVAFCFVYPPLIFLSLLNIAEHRKWRDILMLALSYGAMTLTYVRTAVVFLPAIAIFALWIFLTKKEQRENLITGSVRAAIFYILLAVFPLLPLMREIKWISLFSLDPFLQWQKAFSMKTALSWLDRGGELFQSMPRGFTADAGGFYIGLVTVLIFGILFLGKKARVRRLTTLQGGQFRFFLALAFFLSWLSYGPRSVLLGHIEFLQNAQKIADWSIPIVWFLLFAQGWIIAHLWPSKAPARSWLIALTLIIYFFVPGFSILEKIPFYDQVRAPWFLWEVGGSFALAISIGLVTPMILRETIHKRFARTLICLLLLFTALVDFSAYYARYTNMELPKGTFEDFKKAEEFLAEQRNQGKVSFLSGRYFYLLTPLFSNRGLIHEAFHSHFMLKWQRLLIQSGTGIPDFLKTQLNVSGVSYIAIDEHDPDTPPAIQKFYRKIFSPAFESSHFMILKNPDSLAPSFIGKEWVAVHPNISRRQYQQILTLARLNYVPVTQRESHFDEKNLIGVLNEETPLEVKPEHTNQTGTAFEIHSQIKSRTNFHRIEADELSDKEGWLTICETYHPDWKAYANGKEISVYKTFGALLGVRIPENTEKIEFRFEPPKWYSSFLTASALSWLFCLSAFIAFFAQKKQKHGRRKK